MRNTIQELHKQFKQTNRKVLHTRVRKQEGNVTIWCGVCNDS